MRFNHSFAVSIIKRVCKGNATKANLYARITVDNQRVEISLKEQIDNSNWDSQREIVKGRSIESEKLNRSLDDIKFRIKEKYRMLRDKEEHITAESIKDALTGVQTQLKGHKLKELLDYYKKIWEPKLKNGGFKNYKTTIRYIELFLEHNYSSKDIFLSDVNFEFATEFEHYVRTTPIKAHDPCLGNGIGKHIQRFKRILNWAKKLKWITANPCEEYSCPLKKAKRKKLSIQELVAIEQKKFNDDSLNYVKELFINSCYTGFAFIDAMSLQEKDFEWDVEGHVWCKIYRTKSDILCALPVLESASKILNKYKQEARIEGRKTIFRPITNKTLNDKLKIIQEICEITTPFTFHVARHTFAKTVALKNGVPLETIQMMMGHTKISTTQIYADVDEEKILDDMKLLEEKISRKKEMVLSKSVNIPKRLISM